MQKIIYGTGGLIALLILVGLALPRYARIDVETQIAPCLGIRTRQ